MNDNYPSGMNEREFLVCCILQKNNSFLERAKTRYENGLKIKLFVGFLFFAATASIIGAYCGLHQTFVFKLIKPTDPGLTLVFELLAFFGLLICDLKNRRDYFEFKFRSWFLS